MENTLQTVAELMEIAAITAPKGGGKISWSRKS